MPMPPCRLRYWNIVRPQDRNNNNPHQLRLPFTVLPQLGALCSDNKAFPEAKNALCSDNKAFPEAKNALCIDYKASPEAKNALCIDYRASFFI